MASQSITLFLQTPLLIPNQKIGQTVDTLSGKWIENLEGGVMVEVDSETKKKLGKNSNKLFIPYHKIDHWVLD